MHKLRLENICITTDGYMKKTDKHSRRNRKYVCMYVCIHTCIHIQYYIN